MTNKKDWGKWAERRQSRGGAPTEAPDSPRAQPSGPAELPPPPPGYGWAQHPTYGWMALPLAAAPVNQVQANYPVVQAPTRMPIGTVPYSSGAVPRAPQPRARQSYGTCALVKQGGRDRWAEELERIPDLVMPDNSYDSMAGNPNPVVQQELAGLPEYNDRGSGNPNTPSAAFPAYGMGTPQDKASDLKSGS